MSNIKLKDIINESREFVIIDPRGNARPVGAKSQGAQYIKKMGGPAKGYHMVLKKNALKARRAIEKNGGNATNSKIQDVMFDLMYEGKSNSQKKLDILFKLSIGANVKHGEDRLYKLSQEWESWNVDNDDQYDDLVDDLFAAIELVQDAGEPGKNNVVKDKEYYSYIKSADKLLKKFNVAAKKAKTLHKEGIVNKASLTEGPNAWKRMDELHNLKNMRTIRTMATDIIKDFDEEGFDKEDVRAWFDRELWAVIKRKM